MKTKIVLKLGLMLMIVVHLSCVEWVSSPDDPQANGYEIEYSDPLGLPAIDIAYCGEAILMELWYDQPLWGVYGTATVFNDGEKIYMQLDLLPDSVSAGWYIAETYLFMGEDWLWFNDADAREPDWTTDSYDVITRSLQDGFPSRVLIDTLISDLGTDCFYLAVKARLEHQNENVNSYPRAYINETGIFLATIWGRQVCLEPCEGP